MWGGSQELAQALDRARCARTSARHTPLVARLRVHAIGDQDGHRGVLAAEPGLHLLAYGFVNQGRLKVPELSGYRGLYQTGDTSSFLGLLRTGPQAPEHPGWGGWAGRFRLLRGS